MYLCIQRRRSKAPDFKKPLGYTSSRKEIYLPLYTAIAPDFKKPLDYTSSRKEIYIPLYTATAPDFKKPLGYTSSCKEIYLPLYTVTAPDFKKHIDTGENLLIIEINGPHQESLAYYKQE